MQKTISAIKARRNLGEILNEACYKGDEFVIERAGKPIAALIPLDEFEILTGVKKNSFAILDRIWEKTKGAKLTARDVSAVIERVGKNR